MADIKVKVIGSANNRTALAVLHVYMAMYPKTTWADLDKAFPATLGPSKARDSLFYDVDTFEAFTKTDSGIETDWWVFKDNADFITTYDGYTLTVEATWRGGDTTKLIEYVRKFGIDAEVNKEALEKGKKFKIEFNGYDPNECRNGEDSFYENLSEAFGGTKKPTLNVIGQKKVETLMKEFHEIYPALQLIMFPESERNQQTKHPVDRTKTIAEVRVHEGKAGGVTITGNKLVKTLEEQFDEVYGLYAQVCYYSKDGGHYYTSGDTDLMTLNQFNKKCIADGCPTDKWY